jgi:hypothetical protein
MLTAAQERPPMKAVLWFIVTVGGFGMMAGSYFAWQQIDPEVRWASGIMVVATDNTQIDPDTNDLQCVRAQVRLLPLSELARAMTMAAKDGRHAVAVQLSEKLIILAPEEAGLNDPLLQEGRMPVPGRREVLAGHQVSNRERVTIEGHDLTVVGVLKRDAALLANCYLLPQADTVDELFRADGKDARRAALIELSPGELKDREKQQVLKETFPAKQFAHVVPMTRVDRGPFYVYMAGQALMLLGGSGLIICGVVALGSRQYGGILRDVFSELSSRRRLLWSVHLVYFGLVIVAALLVYEVPSLQLGMLATIRQQATSDDNLLGMLGKAYGSGNIPLAALSTVAVNFILGSILYITLPSLIVPGSGALLAMLRATAWGLLLAPTFSLLSMTMLPHSWTLLLEGEGYILATFFGLLVPILLIQKSLEGKPLQGYKRALLLNLKANLLIGIVLLLAALYEATEVILMMH